VQPQGRPQGSGRALSGEQGQEIRQLVVDSMPCDHDIASATWTRQVVAEWMAKRMGVDLTLQGVGQYLRRWGLTPPKPARQAREQDPEEVREFVEQTLPEVKEQAEQEEAQLHVVDEVGVKTSDQIGTSYAPKGETPVQEVPNPDYSSITFSKALMPKNGETYRSRGAKSMFSSFDSPNVTRFLASIPEQAACKRICRGTGAPLERLSSIRSLQ
jgi:transposase